MIVRKLDIDTRVALGIRTRLVVPIELQEKLRRHVHAGKIKKLTLGIVFVDLFFGDKVYTIERAFGTATSKPRRRHPVFGGRLDVTYFVGPRSDRSDYIVSEIVWFEPPLLLHVTFLDARLKKHEATISLGAA